MEGPSRALRADLGGGPSALQPGWRPWAQVLVLCCEVALGLPSFRALVAGMGTVIIIVLALKRLWEVVTYVA